MALAIYYMFEEQLNPAYEKCAGAVRVSHDATLPAGVVDNAFFSLYAFQSQEEQLKIRRQASGGRTRLL